MDSGWSSTPWVVVMQDDDGGRYDVRVPAAIGRRDAFNQARHDHPDDSPVDALLAVEAL